MRFSGTFISASAIALLGSITNASPLSTDVIERGAQVEQPHPNSVYLRVEGGTSTIYEGEVLFPGPRDITTPSGGTHRCDGTNGGANQSPGPTCTTALDQASKNGRNGRGTFGYDGTYSSQFQDYFITSIGDSPQTGNQFWGVLINEAFTAVGGCGAEVAHGQRAMWAFDAFNKNAALLLSRSSKRATSGVPFTLTVTGNNLNGGSVSGSGATVSEYDPSTGKEVPDGISAPADNTGAASITVSSPGTYYFKAYRSDSIRSNKVKIVVKRGTQ